MALTAKEIGGRLREYRKAAQVTQRQLADACMLSTVTIHNIESGKHRPHKATIQSYLAGINALTGSSFELDDILNMKRGSR